MNCPRQGVSLWLCPHCQTITSKKPCFIDGKFSCCECCCGTMTVRFHAPEPTGWELLRKVAKPGMTIAICGKEMQVEGRHEGRVDVMSPYTTAGLHITNEYFVYSGMDAYFGKTIQSLTRSDIKILFDPEAK